MIRLLHPPFFAVHCFPPVPPCQILFPSPMRIRYQGRDTRAGPTPPRPSPCLSTAERWKRKAKNKKNSSPGELKAHKDARQKDKHQEKPFLRNGYYSIRLNPSSLRIVAAGSVSKTTWFDVVFPPEVLRHSWVTPLVIQPTADGKADQPSPSCGSARPGEREGPPGCPQFPPEGLRPRRSRKVEKPLSPRLRSPPKV